jgi:hypothetical protein
LVSNRNPKSAFGINPPSVSTRTPKSRPLYQPEIRNPGGKKEARQRGRERERDRQTDRGRERETDEQTTDRHSDRERERERETDREIDSLPDWIIYDAIEKFSPP